MKRAVVDQFGGPEVLRIIEDLPLAEALHAHELLGSSASKGKLVLVP